MRGGTVHFSLVTIAWLLIISICSRLTYGTTSMQTWELENYNDWNLPFAKTVEITGRSSFDNYTGSFPHTLSADTYKMEVDPSALFTVLFLEKTYFTDYDESQLINLNYTFLGNK